MILIGPTIRTVIPCGYHQLGATWPDITHDTGSIMIVDMSFERIEVAHFILGAVYASSTFKTVSVFSIFGLVWQTEAVTSSSCAVVMTACYEPWVANQKKTKTISVNPAAECDRDIYWKQMCFEKQICISYLNKFAQHSLDSVESLWSLMRWLCFGILFVVMSSTESTNNIFTQIFNNCHLQALARCILRSNLLQTKKQITCVATLGTGMRQNTAKIATFLPPYWIFSNKKYCNKLWPRWGYNL